MFLSEGGKKGLPPGDCVVLPVVHLTWQRHLFVLFVSAKFDVVVIPTTGTTPTVGGATSFVFISSFFEGLGVRGSNYFSTKGAFRWLSVFRFPFSVFYWLCSFHLFTILFLFINFICF